MGLLVDSSVFIEIERRGLTLDALASSIRGRGALAISALTASELLVGVHLGSPQYQPARSEFVEDVLRSVPVLGFDLLVARLHAAIWADLRRTGTLVSRNDLFIGVTALAHGFSVLTHNIRDFERIPGLDVLRPDLG